MSGPREDLTAIVALLVDEPGAIELGSRLEQGVEVLELSVAERDVGKVIGRQGRTVRALRTLLAAREALGGGACELRVLDG